MKHVWVGIAVGLMVFTAVAIAIALMVILEGLISSTSVALIAALAIFVGAMTAFIDYTTERR